MGSLFGSSPSPREPWFHTSPYLALVQVPGNHDFIPSQSMKFHLKITVWFVTVILVPGEFLNVTVFWLHSSDFQHQNHAWHKGDWDVCENSPTSQYNFGWDSVWSRQCFPPCSFRSRAAEITVVRLCNDFWVSHFGCKIQNWTNSEDAWKMFG